MKLTLSLGLNKRLLTIASGSNADVDVLDTSFLFTDFYCGSTGDNLNAGSTEGAAVFTSAAGDSDGTSVFTPNDGSTPASTVSAGMWGSVYVTAGATVATFVGRITAVAAGVNGAITFSTTAKAGTFPTASAGAHTITMRVGGAWLGPNGTIGFPFNFATVAMTNSSNHAPFINLKNTADYTTTAAITRSTASMVWFAGYSATPRDGGTARIKGPTTGASYVLLTLSGSYTMLGDMEFKDNGATGSASGVALSGTTNGLFRVTATGMRGRGIDATNLSALIECEGYANNTSNSAYSGGIHAATAGSFAVRCVAHNNRGGTNGGGFTMDTSIYWCECISAFNSGDGYQSNADTNVSIDSCDFYNNGGYGMNFTGGSTTMLLSIRNTNFSKNGNWDILFRSFGEIGEFAGNRFGTGTQASTNVGISTTEPFAMNASNNSNYATDAAPNSDATNGIFDITLAAAVGAGIGSFTGKYNGFSACVSYNDIGAAEKRP